MRNLFTCLTAAGFASLACAAETNELVQAEEAKDIAFFAGGDFRLRQELMDNIPGNPGGAPYSVSNAKRGKNTNQFRIRPRVNFGAETEHLRFYTRIADEIREYPVKNGKRRQDRSYTFPDEVYLDNCYLDGHGIEAYWLRQAAIDSIDFRVGRQDMLEGPHSVFGLDRLLGDGTALDGSRTFFADMARTTLHFDDVRKLDLFFLYDNGRNNLSWGNRQSRGRSMNPVNMQDDNQMDEWGGGIIFSDALFDNHLPFKIYSIFKRTESYTSLGRDMSATEVTTLGILLQPQFDEYWGMELEGAKQYGRILDGNRQKGGYMGYLEFNYSPDTLRRFKPKIAWCNTYYSGDKHYTDYEKDNDTGWDPMWARHTQDSELLVYGNLYRNCWWSNMLYTKAKLTMNFGRRHAMYLYSGPMFVAEQDRLGHADHTGKSMYKGWLTAARYDFPLRLAPKNAHGWDRIELYGHVVGEVFNPGDYFDSTKPSYFFRWQIDFKF